MPLGAEGAREDIQGNGTDDEIQVHTHVPLSIVNYFKLISNHLDYNNIILQYLLLKFRYPIFLDIKNYYFFYLLYF